MYKSEVIKKTLDPQWTATPALDLIALCGGDVVSPTIRFDCFERGSGRDDAMGGFVVW